jgi:peptidoglycan/xylan/chitin deacetylase (PgdA/CDA1 family)
LPARALCVTFDDGYADNLTVAAPILARHRMPATVFVVSGCLDGGCMWNDAVIQALRHCSEPVLDLSWSDLGTLTLGSLANRREAIRRTLSHLKYLPPGERDRRTRRLLEQAEVPGLASLMLTTVQLKSLRAHGISVGAHTVTHPILSALEPAQARREIAQSKADLEAITGEAVELFAYPNGRPSVDYDARHVEMVRRAGFKAAVSTAWGVGRRATDVYQLPRFSSWGATTLVRGLRFAQNLRRVSAAA